MDNYNKSNLTKLKQLEVALQRTNRALEASVAERTTELRYANEQLHNEIAERRQTEAELAKSLSLLDAILESTTNGIIAINCHGDIVDFNQKFVEMWQVPDSITASRDHEQWLAFYRDQLKDPESFCRRCQEPNLWDFEGYDTVELKDGRVFERYIQPQSLGEQIIGQVWSFREIAEGELPEEVLQQSEARFYTLAETTDAIIFIIQGMQFRYVNPAAEAITNCKREELIAHSDVCQVLKLKECEQAHESCRPALPQYQEIELVTKSGEVRWLDCSFSMLEFEGKPAKLITAIDITRRKQAELETRQALEKEKELSELRAHFVSMVSHEFRTPLNLISFSTSLLKRHNHQWPEEKKLKYLDRIQTGVEHLSKLLNEVLIIGRAEVGKLTLEPRALDLEQFCRNLVEEIQLSDNNQHAVTFVGQGDCSTAWIDEKLLQPILTNLLSNAIKYSSTGSRVDLALSCRNEQAVFQVKDEGIGIPAADRQRLFDAFYRGGNVGDIPGTGLGLAVVKELVDTQGGEISLQSEFGVGTTFIITLPLSQPESAGMSTFPVNDRD